MVSITGSQYHPFDLNRVLGFDRMVSENLPVAVPLNPDPEDFRALARRAGALFNIEGMEALPAPEWEPRLFDR
jgi:hypothetical protein